MDLQTAFYTLGIIFMSLTIFLMLAIIAVLFYIKKKVSDISDTIAEKLHKLTHMTEDPSIAANVGAAVATTAFKKVKSILRKKK